MKNIFRLLLIAVMGIFAFSASAQEDETPRYITIEAVNPSYIGRVYNDNVMIMSFPVQYNLLDGSTLYVEAAVNCSIKSVTCGDTSLSSDTPGTSVTVDLEGVDEGATVTITAVGPEGDYTYTFTGPEGLSITYRGMSATYKNGMYTLENISDATLGTVPVVISVLPAYTNRVVLQSVTDGTTTWSPAGASGIINIPASELPAANTRFNISYRSPDPAETTRTITLTIDNPDVVSYGLYQGMSGYFGFDANGNATLTISANEYTIEVVTTKNIIAIETDVADTFTLPYLPSTRVVLNLRNVVEGQTINLITGTAETDQISIGEAYEVVINNDTATVSLDYTVSKSLVGASITVEVDGSFNSNFIAAAETGIAEIPFSVYGLEEGSHTFTITLTCGRASASIDITVMVQGAESVVVTPDAAPEIYNLNGVKVNADNIPAGIYIAGGRKIIVR